MSSSDSPRVEIEIPPVFADRIRAALGEHGAAWLRDLPAGAAALADRWQVTLGRPFGLSFNYVTRARRADGCEAVFKVGPWGAELRQEIAALRLYDGDGTCRLLESDPDECAMLLERLHPGSMLAEVAVQDDDEATSIAAGLLRRIWRPIIGEPAALGLRPLAEWFGAFGRHRAAHGGAGPFPERLLARAEALAADLCATAPASMLLHADFHHTNILRSDSERGPWLAIDPKGMVGDPGYDVGPFLLNPEPQRGPKPTSLLARRLDILSEALHYDRARLRDWAYVHAILSACWSAEDHGGGWQSAIGTADNLLDA